MNLSKYYDHTESFKTEDFFKKVPDTGKFVQDRSPRPASDFFRAMDNPPQSQPAATAKAQRQAAANGNGNMGGHGTHNAAGAPPPPVPGQPAEAGFSAANGQGNGAAAPPAIDPALYMSREEANRLIADAHQRGLQEGQAKADEDFGSAARTMLHACQQLETIRETLIQNSSREIVDFILAISEKIIRTSVIEQDQTVVATIEEALQQSIRSDEFTVFVHPDDVAAATAKVPELINGMSSLKNLVIRSDTTVERGGAKIESENCTIDATIAGQFEVIREELHTRMTAASE